MANDPVDLLTTKWGRLAKIKFKGKRKEKFKGRKVRAKRV